MKIIRVRECVVYVFSLSLSLLIYTVAVAPSLLLYSSHFSNNKKKAKMKDVEFQTVKVKKCFYVFGQTNHRAIARLNVRCAYET